MSSYYLVDSHSHPQFSQYDYDREEIIGRALDKDIGIISVGTDFEMSKKAVELTGKYKDIWASVGLHPNDAAKDRFNSEDYSKLAKNKKVIAIGETGLDYYRTKDENLKIKQKEIFLEHIKISQELNRPLIIHCRNAHGDMIEILRKRSGLNGVIHSFTGTWQDAQKYFELGFYIGLNGIITFARDYDETILNAPLDRILLETDAPFLTPEPFRGKRNEPSYVRFVAEKLAELKGLNVNETVKITVENTKNLFKL